MKMAIRASFAVGLLAFLVPALAFAQLYDSGSTGELGALEPTKSVKIDLPPDGVLNYTSVYIPSGVTVTFRRNVSNTPVYLLATDNVQIDGAISVSGGSPAQVNTVFVSRRGGIGGPGGQDGGCSRTGSGLSGGQAGQGPGAGLGSNSTAHLKGGGAGASPVSNGSGASQGGAGGNKFADPDQWILSGGSGGGASPVTGGGGGGGVVVIASSKGILLNGGIYANGADTDTYGGQGGAGFVRLVGEQVSGSGAIEAVGNKGGCNNQYEPCGGTGIIRIDSFQSSGALLNNCVPTPYFGTPDKAVPYPDPATAPTLTIGSIHGQAPTATSYDVHPMLAPEVVVPQGEIITIVVNATWVPTGSIPKVIVNTIGKGRITIDAPPLNGTLASSTTAVEITIPAGTRVGTVQAWLPQVPVPND